MRRTHKKSDWKFVWRPDADFSGDRPIAMCRLLGLGPRAIADLTGSDLGRITRKLRIYGETRGGLYYIQPEAYEAMKLPSWIPKVSQPMAKLNLEKIAATINMLEIDEDNCVRMKSQDNNDGWGD